MPTYEWICQTCRKGFETQSSIRKLTQPGCPACNSNQVNRRFSSQIGVIMRPGPAGKTCDREGRCHGRTEQCEGHECSRDG